MKLTQIPNRRTLNRYRKKITPEYLAKLNRLILLQIKAKELIADSTGLVIYPEKMPSLRERFQLDHPRLFRHVYRFRVLVEAFLVLLRPDFLTLFVVNCLKQSLPKFSENHPDEPPPSYKNAEKLMLQPLPKS